MSRTPPALRSRPAALVATLAATLVAAFAAGPCAAGALGAQVPVPSLSLGFGVDTTAADVGGIVRLLRAYLAQPDTAARARGLWSVAGARDRRSGDLTRDFAYQGFPATVLGVTSAGPGDSVYTVKVLHATADSTRRRITPVALQRLYALRDPGAPHGWRLAGALPRLTRGWTSYAAGRITFWYAPGQRRDRARAVRAARFVDSVATLFGVRPPERIDYYVTASPEEYHRILGLDFFPLPSGRSSWRGGRALAGDGIVLSGDPTQGEAYLHELAHVVLGPAFGTNFAVSEGIATWLGGSQGRAPRELFAILRRYHETRPTVTLSAIVRGEVPSGWGPPETDALYATAVLFVDAVHRRAGIAGLRALAGIPAGAEATFAAIREHLALPSAAPAELDRWWRQAAAEAAR